MGARVVGSSIVGRRWGDLVGGIEEWCGWADFVGVVEGCEIDADIESRGLQRGES